MNKKKKRATEAEKREERKHLLGLLHFNMFATMHKYEVDQKIYSEDVLSNMSI